ncbi:Rop guanine nucleotide exchange factor 14-like protein [Drosera capensis]
MLSLLRLSKAKPRPERGERSRSRSRSRMKRLGKRLGNCCTSKHAQISIDFDELPHQRMITYDGLESCILKSNSSSAKCGMSIEDEFDTGYLDDDDTTSCSSSRDPSSSSSKWTAKKEDIQETKEWDMPRKPRASIKQKPAYVLQFSDIDGMRELFTKLLLGEDVTGGRKGMTSARALSNAITNLGASVFGELWKLQPLPEEKKTKWRKEMDWLLSPANYMVELVPAQRKGSNGRTFEIMTPKARADIHMNLPALQKLDSMLIEILDSMVKTEFWYADCSTLGEARDGFAKTSNRRLPFPRIPKDGLPEKARKKLLCQGNLVHQVFKAAKSINEDVLHGMPLPGTLKNLLPRSVRSSLGDDLFKVLSSESSSPTEMAVSLKLMSDHELLDIINKLEAAALVTKDRINEQAARTKSQSQSWSFLKGAMPKLEKMNSLLSRVEALLHELKIRFPYIPHSFIDVMKVNHCKDVGHSILEAYSRFLASLAYNMLSRIVGILEEDHLCNPTSPLSKCSFRGVSSKRFVGSPLVDSLMQKMDNADWQFSDSNRSRSDSDMFSPCTSESKASSTATETPGGSCVWCISTDHGSPEVSP